AEAEISLRQALAIAPDHRRSHNHLGVVLAHRGQPDQALAAFRRADCSPAQAHANLALILTLNHQSSDAQQHLRYAQSFADDDQGTQERLAAVEALLSA